MKMILSLSLAGLLVAPQQVPFRSAAQVVTLTVGVSDKRAPVSGLRVGDFVVVDNGVAQSAELLPPETVPLDVTIVVGAYGLRVDGMRLEPDIKQLIGWLQPQDRIRVISHARDVVEVASLRPVVDLPKGSWWRDIWFAKDNIDHTVDPRLAGAASWDAILLALAAPTDVARRAMVIDFWTEDGFGSAVPDGALIAAAAARSNALVYVATAPGVTEPMPTSNTFHQYQEQFLTEAAEATGGGVRHTGGGMEGIRSALEEFRTSYVLRYTLSGAPTQGWHQVQVNLPKYPRYVVRTRKGYLGK